MSNRINRKFKKRPIWLIYLPIVTMIIIGLLYMYSSHSPRLFYSWEGIRESVRDTVVNIGDNGHVTASHVGLQAVTPQQYNRRTWLINKATINELSRLTEYPDEAVKAIAYEGLLRRDSTRRFEILMTALEDSTTFFNYQEGCEGDILMLGEYLIENVLQIHVDDLTSPPPPPGKNIFTFSDEEMIKIKDRYIARMEKKWEYYQRLQE